jgi:SAM-dependent methyltransferase
MTDLESFYDQLAADYPLIYQDWEASLKRQAAQLDTVLRGQAGEPAQTVLDAACGIGTQAIGLAELGYRVTASDISQASIDRAADESRRRGLAIAYLRSDMRRIDEQAGGGFDAVIACDNAVPHLPTEADILQAMEAFYRSLKPGGMAMISSRDYAGVPRDGQLINPRRVHVDGDRRLILFDVWDFNGDHYDLTLYMVDDPGVGAPTTRAIRGGRYFCISLDRLQALMVKAGFEHVKQLAAAYFQPLIIGRR